MAVETRFPKWADNPQQFLIWEVDEVMPIAVFFILFLPARNLLLGLIIGVTVSKLYKKLKDRLPHAFAYHFLWYFGLWTPKVKNAEVPKGYISVYRQ